MKIVRVIEILLITLLVSCNSKVTDDDKKDLIDSIITGMQKNIDSAVVLCNQALKDYGDGKYPKDIAKEYGPSINSLEKSSVDQFQKATQMYKTHQLSQEDYDLIRHEVITDTIKFKVNKLKSLGISFK